jgi:RND superfamily putative drug exporter
VAPGGTAYDGRVALTVIGEPLAGTSASDALVEQAREAVHAIPAADARVGGSPAELLDARAAADRDLRVIAPVILALIAAVLMLLLRAVTAPLVLLLINIASSLATIGVGSWLGRTLFGFPALDVQVPLIAFLFLVALGVDYTIFLVHRAQDEARTHGVREGMALAVGHTGAVITSAGVVLAGVFAALGVLPLVVLGQLGLIVGLGVLIDTFLVRALLVPGVIAALGDRAYWPRRLPAA